MTTSSGFFCVLYLLVNPIKHNWAPLRMRTYIAARPLVAPGLRWLRSELRRSAAMMYEGRETAQIISQFSALLRFCSLSLFKMPTIGMEVFGVNAGKLPCAEIGARKVKTNRSPARGRRTYKLYRSRREIRDKISKKEGWGVEELIKEVEKISASTETAEVHFAYQAIRY
jgi:hypothetical protein